ncbi:hypothetical protein BU14_1501s0001 [Porphyra umbilicalis]|uniref:Uncharacterized protein n=1 Tax=Porphyra umbilicalis TaxID=2786 RepID=A0A1X6NM88_PORUM|nr:hypothetical protein BU14_1501s0001 [Porphyra umbilicalis]|eukprot:OSX69453.1 hypothetical protein BU14_1501s0001 [Porphyra umbilicalis]
MCCMMFLERQSCLEQIRCCVCIVGQNTVWVKHAQSFFASLLLFLSRVPPPRAPAVRIR